MNLSETTLDTLKKRREVLLNGGINTIPSPFKRFSKDFLGWEKGLYYIISSYTKGKR